MKKGLVSKGVWGTEELDLSTGVVAEISDLGSVWDIEHCVVTLLYVFSHDFMPNVCCNESFIGLI